MSPLSLLRVGVALCSAVAFASLWRDAALLMGPEGLLPAIDLIRRVQELDPDPFLRLPSLFHYWPPADGSLTAWAAVGVIGSLLLAWPRATPYLALPLAFLYLSFVNVGSDFFSFQWDGLLVETLVLTALLGPAPGRGAVVLFGWLWFRLCFESGYAKVQGGKSWLDLTAMADYWATAPLPTPLAWYADRLPLAVQKALTALSLAVECGAPFLILFGRRARQLVFVLWLGLQLGILLTANYGFFNYLSIVVAFSLLIEAPPRWRTSEGIAAALLIPLSLIVAIHRFHPDKPLPELAQAVMRTRVVNVYHLFVNIDPIRDEVEVIGSDDGKTWETLPFRYKPLADPTWVAPYHPRVDFRLWFATLGNRSRPPGLIVKAPLYLSRIIEDWCEAPARLTPLLTHEVHAPALVRLRYRRVTFDPARPGYSFTELGLHPKVHRCESGGLPDFPQVAELDPL